MNIIALEEEIDKFLVFIEDQLDMIKRTGFERYNNVFKKVLYIGVLDTLSKTVCHSNENRKRMLTLINHFCDWPYKDRVSLPHLIRLLEKVPDPEFSELRKYAFELFDKWWEGDVVYLDKDPRFENIRRRWPKNIPETSSGIKIELLQHINLFYRYRNTLVHELRKPGYGVESEQDTKPFYLSQYHTSSEIRTWELVYPVAFYEDLCRSAIKNLKRYYLEERINPYDQYKFGTYWIEELN